MKKIKYTGFTTWFWPGVDGDRDFPFEKESASNDAIYEISDKDYHYLIEKTKNQYFEPVTFRDDTESEPVVENEPEIKKKIEEVIKPQSEKEPVKRKSTKRKK